MARPGQNFRLQIETSPGVWEFVPGERSVSGVIGNLAVDTTTKDEMAPSYVPVSPDVEFAYLRTQMGIWPLVSDYANIGTTVYVYPAMNTLISGSTVFSSGMTSAPQNGTGSRRGTGISRTLTGQSMGFWFRIQNEPSAVAAQMSTNGGMLLKVERQGTVYPAAHISITAADASKSFQYPIGSGDHHICLINTGTSWTVYLDGLPIDSGTMLVHAYSASQYNIFTASKNLLNGICSCFHIDRALTVPEIAYLATKRW